MFRRKCDTYEIFCSSSTTAATAVTSCANFFSKLPVFQNFKPTIKEMVNTDFTKGELKTDTSLRYVIRFGSPMGNPCFPFPFDH
jgi:hypothetical protein